MKKHLPSRHDLTQIQVGLEIILGGIGALALMRWLGM